ncbi:hypothetical protein SPRG_20643 [Saprolegnia parasitica CBS 223.65]|uniref:Tesmin/TSO1-like CXC domain-containing protein n=1 Tax=Saprolegnia parasitica (strain CBS 223.65) TaxID=695850 RepID=A0A067CG30_SAPPC|nr:hypothetical protein SPRG_20643 [Saprolegnia parasitica CBS 223.65]KDO25521.1 hypothetical protein SPRG_20643 [Saprolegnia parasitica CBS 223.65]|eukprot:XP_012203752.1 hypothetical protein SPRG_20643 [Saprolegnia parasitica CBS 223.65]
MAEHHHSTLLDDFLDPDEEKTTEADLMSWPNQVHELDSAFSSFILDPQLNTASPSVTMSPSTLAWLQQSLGSGTLSAHSQSEQDALLHLFSPYTMPSPRETEFRGGGIDWKVLNEAAIDEDAPTQWKEIPQSRLHPDMIPPTTSMPISMASAASATAASLMSMTLQDPSSLPKMLKTTAMSMWPLNRFQQQTNAEQQPLPMPDVIPPAHPYSLDAGKRRMLVSPEFEQFEAAGPVVARRPSKKPPADAVDVKVEVKKSIDVDDTKSVASTMKAPEDVRCRCTGKCRNARCACVKAGRVCGVECKCQECSNPFVPMQKKGIQIEKMIHDKCLMQNLSKIRSMEDILMGPVEIDCSCGSHRTCHVYETLLQPELKSDGTYAFPVSCTACDATFHYSWCTNKVWSSKQPRKHCEICKRCGSHRSQHCHVCNHCYFAGVANSFSCPCQSPANAAPPSELDDTESIASTLSLPFNEPLKTEADEKDDEQCPVQ